MTRSGSTGMLVRPKAADATDFKREHTMLRSSSIAGGLAAQIKSAVAGADPLAQAPGVRRPLSRTTISRRRPAPKVITDGAVQLRSGSLANLCAEGGLDDSLRSLPTPSTCCSTSPGGGSPPGSTKTAGYPAGPCPRLLQQSDLAQKPETALAADVKGALCSVQMAPDAGPGGNSDIRTKVFRVGAPLLRSTIPLSISMGRSGGTSAATRAATASEPAAPSGQGAPGHRDEDEDMSDVESVRSSSEIGVDDLGTLKVTLDFPC